MKTYKIITLGASGSGKTVFLASMYKALSIQGDHSFYLEVEDQKKRKLLNSVYTQLITGDSWPQGTRYSEVSEWTFTCRVKTPSLEDYPACQFIYFDYAGGRLTDQDEDAEFESMVKQADAILGLLDGQKILAWMSDSNELAIDSFLKKDLPSILHWMQCCKVPIQFVLSKWDLLENKFSLDQVRDHLLTIPAFEKLIRSRNKANCPVRLIPVSSVGSSFVAPAPDGSMKKIAGAIPDPFQVEVPVASVLPDQLRSRLSEILEQKKQLEVKEIDKPNTFFNFFNAASPMLNIAIDLAGLMEIDPSVKMLKVVGGMVRFGANAMQKAAQEKAEKLRQEKENSLKLVKDEQTALDHAINNFLYIQNELYKHYPQSELILS